jgi:hypothetical protein
MKARTTSWSRPDLLVGQNVKSLQARKSRASVESNQDDLDLPRSLAFAVGRRDPTDQRCESI